MRRSRWKLLLLGSLSCLLALVGVLAALDQRSPWVALGSIGFGLIAIFALREAVRRDPALIIDGRGIEDTRVGLRLEWDEVERVSLYRRWVRLVPQTWLLLRVKDLPAVVERIPRAIGRRIGRLDANLGVRTIFFVLNMLAVRPRRILEEIRRRYRGPVES